MSLSTSGRTWEDASSPDAVQRARRYENAWRAAGSNGRRPDLDSALADAVRTPGAALAILRVDLTLRFEAGESVDASEYRKRFDWLDREGFVALVYEEFCLREEAGEDLTTEEMLARHPEIVEPLRRVLDIHGLVGSGSGLTTASHFGSSSEPPVAFPIAGETIAGYRLVEELGRGAFARVFLAEERQLADRPVALKVARAGSREPQTLARLQHTHIVPIYSTRTDPATSLHVLCMPYFGRVTLARLLSDPQVKQARSGSDLVEALDRLGAAEPSPTGRAAGRAALARRDFAQAIAWWGARMAEALDHAHDRGVLHRDVKPSNVLVTGDAMPMLLDFNLAREIVVDGLPADQGLPGGTFDYMAPEQLEELAHGIGDQVDARSDLYGLGILLYEAVMGRRPFSRPRDATTPAEMLLRAADERRAGAPRLRDTRPEVPTALEVVIRRCLAPDPAARYASAAELAVDLQAVADDRPLRYAVEPWPARTYRWVRRHRRVLAAVVPVMIAAAVLLGVYFRDRAARERLFIRGKHVFDDGMAAWNEDDIRRAKLQFELAARLLDQPGLESDAAQSQPNPRGLSSVFTSIDELRQAARGHFHTAQQTEDFRHAADRLFAAGDSLRFRLVFPSDHAAALRELDRYLEPFHVLKTSDWLRRHDMELLDDPRRERLKGEIGELLFLRAVLLDYSGEIAAYNEGISLCDRAVEFAASRGPWRALRARLEAERDGGDPSVEVVAPAEGDAIQPRVCFQWGALRLRENRRTEAIHWLQNAARLDPGNHWYEYFLGHAYDDPESQAGQNEALNHYNVALGLNPKSPWVRFSRARIYRARAAWDLAIDDFQRALSDFLGLPDEQRDGLFETQYRLEVGLLHQSLGNLALARESYEQVIAGDPSPGGAYARAAQLNRAKLEVDAGHVNRALADYDAMLRADPDDRFARLGRALLALRLGDAATAEAELNRLLARTTNPADRAELLTHRALALLTRGCPRDALADIDVAAVERLTPHVERLRARTRIALGAWSDVALIEPEDLDALPVGGQALRDDLHRFTTNLRGALTSLAGTASLEARLNLAVALAALHDPTAELEAGTAVGLAPLSPRAYLTRARVRRNAGQLDAAREDVERALVLDRGDPRAWELRASIRFATQDLSGARLDLDQSIALGDTPRARALRARVLLRAGDPAAALVDWSQVIANDPDDPRALLGRAETYIALHRWDHALADLELASGWTDGRPDLGFRIALAYARCLGDRPDRLPRLLAIARTVVLPPRLNLLARQE